MPKIIQQQQEQMYQQQHGGGGTVYQDAAEEIFADITNSEKSRKVIVLNQSRLFFSPKAIA